VVGVGELSEAVSTGCELVVADSVVGVCAAAGVAEPCKTISTGGGEFLVADSAVGVCAAAGLAEPCKTISTGGGELLVADSAVAGVGDAATDGVFGSRVTPRITKTSTRPVNTASVPKKICFARGTGRARVGSGGGTMVDRGGAPHEGQAIANELISLPHS
jgi:hypothetical protein